MLSLDSGGNYGGYIGDLCRMGILGEPDAELDDLLAEVDAIQQATRKPIRAGAPGGDVYAAAEAVIARSPHREGYPFRRARHGADRARGAAAVEQGARPLPRRRRAKSRSKPAW